MMIQRSFRQGICAIVSKSHMAQARNMAESYRKHHPDKCAFVLVYDMTLGELPRPDESFVVIPGGELAQEFPEFEKLAFKYTAFELACVLKPYFLLYLFNKYRLQSAFYVDSDIQFYSSIESLHSQLLSHAVLLVPHSVKAGDLPMDEPTLYSDTLLLLTGAYNAGFIGVSANQDGIRFLNWWKERLSRDCAINPSKGLYHDQRWLDLVPAAFEDVYIERGEEFNVAFWNLRAREISFRKGRYYCGKRPLAFFHFSHIDLNNPLKMGPAWTMRKAEPNRVVRALIQNYCESLMVQGYSEASQVQYGFSRFENGAIIPREARRLYQQASLGKNFEAPFSTRSSKSFYRWMLKRKSNKPSPLELELKKYGSKLSSLDPKIRADLLKASKNQ